MKVSVETLQGSEAILNVDYSWEELEKASDKAYRQLVQKVDIQGFRRGKAPRSLLERRLGKEYIYQEGLENLITETYRDAMKEHSMVPLAQPTLDAPTLEMGQPYHLSITVPIYPTVELGDYSALHFERPTAEVTSEEVEQELENRRNRQANWEEVERPAQINDRVTMDLKLTVGEQNVSDLKNNPFELTDERHGLFSDMDEHIVGMQVGESKTFSTTIPASYANEKLAGQSADYEVTLHKVEFKEIPELDDAFAISVSNEQFQTIEDLRKNISDQLLERKKRTIEQSLQEQALSALTDLAQMTLHPLLIDQQVHDLMHQMTHVLEQQHMSMDQYLMVSKKTEAEYMAELRPEAERQLRQQVALDEFIKQEKITVSPDEIETLLRLYAQVGQPLPETPDQIRSLAANLQRQNAITTLLKLTTDPDPDEEEETVEEESAAAIIDSEESDTPTLPVVATDDVFVEADNEEESDDTVVPNVVVEDNVSVEAKTQERSDEERSDLEEPEAVRETENATE